MAVLFFNLRGVPQDEADDVRELLQQHDIGFYETDAGNWGLSLPAIWLYDEEDLTVAQPLFDNYQQQRTIQQRALYREAIRTGQHQGFFLRNRRQPLRFLLFCSLIALFAYASVKWLFELGLQL